MKFTASRLSDGNKLFPASISIEASGVTVKIPGFFSGESKYFDFRDIASVDVKAPLVGYSTITFYAGGTNISAHGFTSSEVKQIKQAIENGKSKKRTPDYDDDFKSSENFNTYSTTISNGDEIRANAEVERSEREEKSLRPWQFDENFQTEVSISKIVFPDVPEDIEKTILRIIRSGVDKVKKTLNEREESLNSLERPSMKSVFKTFSGTFDKVWSGGEKNGEIGSTDTQKFVDACLDKATEGVRKLRRYEGSTIKMMMEDINESMEDLKNKWLPKLTQTKSK